MQTNANEDSDSEEDLDYNPSVKEVAEAEREEKRAKKQKLDPEDTIKALKTSKKVSSIWSQLQNSSTMPSSNFSFKYGAFSSLARESQTQAVPASEKEWMRQYGITTVVPKKTSYIAALNASSPAPPPLAATTVQTAGNPENGHTTDQPAAILPNPLQKESLADRGLDLGLAARALALAKGGSSSTAAQLGDKVAVTEVRRFAGKDVLVSKVASKEEANKLKQKEAEQKSGLDSVLASLQNTKKVTVMDKSRDDWGQVKKSDAQLEEELEAYKKSGDKYLDKVDFLKRSELREYEAERDLRLQNDMRTRGR